MALLQFGTLIWRVISPLIILEFNMKSDDEILEAERNKLKERGYEAT